MSINGSSSSFLPYTLSGLTDATFSNSNIGNGTATTLQITTATPSKIARFDANQYLVSAAVDVSDLPVLNANNTFGVGYTNNLNSAIKTVNNSLAIGNPGINAPSMTAVAPSTYTLVSGFWRFVAPSATTGSMQFPPYFTTTSNQKYILTLTGCSTNGTAPVVATVYNATTLATISDAPQTITSIAQTITFTFTTGSSPCIVYLNFSAGAINYFVQWSALSVQECDTEVIGSLILDSPIISNINQATGTTANLAGGLLVAQTATGASAATFTTSGMPATAPSSTITFATPVYTLTGAGVLAMWLGAGTTYINGAKYTFNFGTMFGSQALQLQVVQYNSAGSAYTMIGDYYYGVSTTSSTISGSFTVGSNVSYTGSVLFLFTPTIVSQNVKFNTFTLTRADTSITGVATLPPNAGTATSTLGLNSSNQIVSFAAPSFSGVSVGYVPYESATDTFSNSFISQSGNTLTMNNMTVGLFDLGYTGGSFTAGTGIGSIIFSSPTYTANASASYQGIINLTALSSQYLNLPCLATITNVSFSLFALSPYPYFTLTSGSTVVYTSAVGASGTIAIPFTPTSTALFITIYFKTPPAPFTGAVFSWNTFTIGAYTATAPRLIANGDVGIGITNPSVKLHIYGTSTVGNQNRIQIEGNTSDVACLNLKTGTNFAYMFNDTNGHLQLYPDSTSKYVLLQPSGGRVGINTVAPSGTLDIGGIIRMGNYTGGNYDNIQFLRGTGSGEYPNIRCQDNYVAMYVSNAGGWVSDSQVGDMVLRPDISLRVGRGGASSLVCHSNTNVGIGIATPTYKLDVFGSMRVNNGDASFTTYQPTGGTWNATMNVGSGTNRGTAQVFATDGNLHMDAQPSKDMYYGYYPNAAGTSNTHRFYGNMFLGTAPAYISGGGTALAYSNTGGQIMRSNVVQRMCWYSNSSAWAGGVNAVYAFYKSVASEPVKLTGRFSYYVGGNGMAYPYVRVYSQSAGVYSYYSLQSYFNVSYNHTSQSIDLMLQYSDIPYTGWFDVYFYNNGGCITDGNDFLWINATNLIATGY